MPLFCGLAAPLHCNLFIFFCTKAIPVTTGHLILRLRQPILIRCNLIILKCHYFISDFVVIFGIRYIILRIFFLIFLFCLFAQLILPNVVHELLFCCFWPTEPKNEL